jgi:hypothetical protein
LDANAPAIPCGLVAKSFFNDKYALKLNTNEVVDLDENNIAWESEKARYKNIQTKNN